MKRQIYFRSFFFPVHHLFFLGKYFFFFCNTNYVGQLEKRIKFARIYRFIVKEVTKVSKETVLLRWWEYYKMVCFYQLS